MPKLCCSPILKDAPSAACLLPYVEEQVLRHHCCHGHSISRIAIALGLTTTETRRLHDRAAARLSAGLLHLLHDLRDEGLGAEPLTLLRSIAELQPYGERATAPELHPAAA
jgi:hypothetical protein